MPEGDTIWKSARALHDVLAGRLVTGFRSPMPAAMAGARRLRVLGSTVTIVEARGKHLLMRFSSGAVLHTHLRLHGSWHLYRPGTPWRRPAGQARAVVETPEAVAVCFAAPVVEVLSAAEEAAHPALSALGPDVLHPGFVAPAAVPGLRARSALEIGEALLDQTALSGIGNIYKSETLFLCGVDPFAAVATLDEATLDRLVRTAQRQMKRGLESAARRATVAGAGRYWVYQRTGRPCRRCGTLILMRRQGEQGRVTYWCPRCQPRRTMPGLPQEGDLHAPAARRPAHRTHHATTRPGATRRLR